MAKLQSHHGPRSNFSFLPFRLRFKVIGMIQDGCTASAIGADPEVAKAYARLGGTFNRATLTRIRKSAEYKELAAKRAAHKAAEYEDQTAAAMIREAGSLDNIADQAKVTLMKALSDLLARRSLGEGGSDLTDLYDESRVKALRSLAQSVTALANQQKDNRISELTRKLHAAEELHAAAEQEWKVREAELLARIAELEGGRKGPAMSRETLAEVEQKIKLL